MNNFLTPSMHGWPSPTEIATLVLYLASGAGSYASGQSFVVDAGELVLAPTDQN